MVMELGYIDGHEATYLTHKSNQEIMAESTTVIEDMHCYSINSSNWSTCKESNRENKSYSLIFTLVWECFFLLLELGFE